MSAETTTKSHVRSDFRYAREMMRQADAAMKSGSADFEDMESIANELIAAASTFAQWIEEQKEAAAEKQEESMNPLAVIMPSGSFNQQEWNAWAN